MKAFFEFLSNDWNKIPQNLRYILWFGIFLIFNSWLLDHWGLNETYLFWGWDLRQFGYSLGTTAIIIAFIFLVLKQFAPFAKVIWYRRKYPLNSINKSYYLIWFNGKLYLFDKKKREYCHVYPWGTAQDLKFVGRGFPLGGDINTYKAVVWNGKQIIVMSKYKEGSPINTQDERH